jgi:FkbM family methyltransferase
MFSRLIGKLRKKHARHVFRKKLKQLDANDICIDCGANVGDITYQFAARGASVYAFEPDPLAFEHLQKRFLGSANVHLVNAAISTKAGRMLLYRSSESVVDPTKISRSSSLLLEKTNVSTANSVLVDVIDFIAFCTTLKAPIKILKMDIEGSEIELLESLTRNEGLLCRFENIFVETHERKIPGTKNRILKLKQYFSARKRPYVNFYWR